VKRHQDGPIGVVLAGGSGRRIGGSKAMVRLQGRPLISYPLEALTEALGDVAVIAKADTELPSMPGVALWIETDPLQHPLVGIRHALGLAEGRAVMVCAADLPFVTPDVVLKVAGTEAAGAPAVVACCRGAVQPLLGCYQPQALELLAASGLEVSVRDAVAAIDPVPCELEDPDVLFNINSPDDLLQAAAMLDRGRGAGLGEPRRGARG
jgi:molybdopterin-guanine dinucleotide biosynthesis protein A